jgi:hypothetical protein
MRAQGVIVETIEADAQRSERTGERENMVCKDGDQRPRKIRKVVIWRETQMMKRRKLRKGTVMTIQKQQRGATRFCTHKRTC